jgi:hypothetical protein
LESVCAQEAHRQYSPPERILSEAFSSAEPLSLSSLAARVVIEGSCTINKKPQFGKGRGQSKKRSFGKSKRLRTNWQIQKIVRALATPFHEDALAALAAALGSSRF